MSSDPITAALAEVEQELREAVRRYGPMASAHEGWAVLKEEVDELWDEVRKSPRKRVYADMHAEAVQCAAMAVRFMLDVTLPEAEEV